MSFWTSPDFYPNIASKFLVTIGGIEGGGQFLVRSVSSLPSYRTELIGGDLNPDGTGYDPIKKQSRIRWDPITISFVNDANSTPDQSVLFKFFQMLYESGYNPLSSAEDGTTPVITDIPSVLINNRSAYDYLGSVTIDLLHPSGYSTAQFELIDPVMTAVSVAGTNYDTDNIHTFDVTFQYSHIKYQSFSCTT